ncbi:MAG: large subunit ribosomal protein L25 [Candidatus Paceibacteria bacterium]|jgi:large subunit ribosomal protein L25
MLTLQATKRDLKEKLSEIREKNNMPAVFYGPKEESTPITISKSEFEKVFKEAGESSIVTLKEGSDEHQTLVYSVDRDPVSGEYRHVDFYVIEKGKKVEVSVPLTYIGESPAEKTLNGNLVKVIHELDIKASPKDLPSELNVDISVLVDFESQIHAKDIKLPEGVELMVDPEEVIALVQEAREEEEPVDAPDLDSIVVQGEKKEEEVEEEAK